MKKILLILTLFISIVSIGQTSLPKYIFTNEGRIQLRLKANAFNLPVGTTPTLQTNQWNGFGGMFGDSTGGNIGIHYYNGTGFIRMVDTTMTTFLSTIGRRFGFIGEDTRATADRSFSMANNKLLLDSLDSRFVTHPKTLSTRRIRLSSTDGTDSSTLSVEGGLTGNIRSVQINTNTTSTGTYNSMQLRDGGGTATQIFATGNGVNESLITLDTNKVSFARRNVLTTIYGAILEVHDKYQDQWGDDSVVWRVTDRSGQSVISRNNVALYAGQNEVELNNPTGITLQPYKQNLYIDSLQHKLTATAKMMTWDSTTGRVETRAIPARMLNSQYADVGNVGAGEDDLMTYSIPASTLVQNGDYIEFEMDMQYATASTKQIKIYFGAQLIASNTTGTAVGFFNFKGKVIRTGATTQRCTVTMVTSSATYQYNVDYATAAETLSGAITLKATGTATSNNDIVQHLMTVKYFPTN